MDQFQNKDIIQAVLIADNNINNFLPFSNYQSTSLIPIVNVPLLDYALESLNRSGVEEVFIFSRIFINDVREHIKKRIESCCSWSVKMNVNVIGGEGCRCLGDALRDLDGKGLIRSHFIMMGANTITNANLKPLLEQHKKNVKFDKGTALTVIFKEVSTGLRTGDEIMIAKDVDNNRLHFHQRIKPNTKERNFKIPLEIFLINSQIALQHNLIDPQIAICSPTLLSLFSDNFDFETRDDFIKGLLINEEILDSRIYVAMLPQEQYARKVSNWLTYQITSYDIINRWAYPLVPDMGICSLKQNYLYLRNNIYKGPTANILRGVILKENVVIHENSLINTGSIILSSVIGKNCTIGKKCSLENTFLCDNVVVEDNCKLQYCVIGNGAKIGLSNILDGVVIGEKVIIPQNSELQKVLIQYQKPEDDAISQKVLGNQAYIIDDTEEIYPSDSDDEEIEPQKIGVPKMMKLPFVYDDSDYNSTSEEEESRQGSPIPDDANIFLSEVIDSLTRGFQDKSNPDFLILEINSSRYAYNMTLKEVNFYVVKAVFSLSHIKESNTLNVLQAVHQVLNYLGTVITNYIKTDEAFEDCLKAVEECLNENSKLRSQAAKIIHYMYDKEYVTEDAILKWHQTLDLESEWLKLALNKLVEWLNQSSEDETSDSDES